MVRSMAWHRASSPQTSTKPCMLPITWTLEPSLSTLTTKPTWLLHSEASSSPDLEKILVRHFDKLREYTINLILKTGAYLYIVEIFFFRNGSFVIMGNNKIWVLGMI